MTIRRSLVLMVVGVWAFSGSGCSLQNLKESNRRLRESNDRLIAENNRLEMDVDQLHQEVAQLRLVQVQPALRAETRFPGADLIPVSGNLSGNLGDVLLDDIDPAVSVTRTNEGVRFTLKDRVFFAPGQAKLSSGGRRILGKVAQRIRRDYGGRTIRVEGHTDDTPTRKVKHLYPTNWELSTARACSVVRYLIDEGSVADGRIYPSGFSYHRPLAHGRSAKARSQNRRVEITVLDR